MRRLLGRPTPLRNTGFRCDPLGVAQHQRISPVLKALFNAPGWLFRRRLGWLLGPRFLALTHLGRKTGAQRITVLEVAVHDPATLESIVVSAYGAEADWYRNIQANPALRVQSGRLDYRPVQRFLSAGEAREAAVRFCAEHPWEARLAPRVLPAIGAVVGDGDDPAEMLASLPMVAFQPE